MVPGAAKAMTAATPTSTASAPRLTRAQVRRDPVSIRTEIRPPATTPTRKAPREVRLWNTENPGAPAAAKPSTTTLPVMFATKTWPRPR